MLNEIEPFLSQSTFSSEKIDSRHTTFLLEPKLKMKLAILSSALLLISANAFVPSASTKQTSRLYSMVPSDENPFEKFIDNVKMRARIAQESNKAGASPKQTIADVLAGEFDQASVEDKIEEAIASAPCGE